MVIADSNHFYFQTLFMFMGSGDLLGLRFGCTVILQAFSWASQSNFYGLGFRALVNSVPVGLKVFLAESLGSLECSSAGPQGL